MPRRLVRRRVPAVMVGLLALVAACSGAKVPDAIAPEPTAPGSGGPVPSGTAGASPGSPGASTSASASASAAPGATARPTGGTAAGPRSTATVTVPGGGGTPGWTYRPSNLFSAKEDRVGITDDTVRFCAHAALIFGAAFNTEAADFNVYWRWVNDRGGIHDRKVEFTFEDDAYSPQQAISAATRCKEKDIFALISGIGFDQIPAVRAWAETERMLYIHREATVKGAAGKRFSFSGLPTVEKLGASFAELVVSRYRNKKIGIVRRQSDNWEPGHEAFQQIIEKYDVKVVVNAPVTNGQGVYTQQINALRNAGAEVVWIWENALAAFQIVKQGRNQGYDPTWLVFPFNLTSQQLGDDALNPSMVGVAAWPAYSKGDYSGPFAPYAADIKEFEAAYRKYRPNTDLSGVGGDLLYLTWVGMRALGDLLEACGRDCTRNRFAGLLESGYHQPTKLPTCAVDYRRGKVGGYMVSVFETFRSSANRKVNWRPQAVCREHLL